MGKYNVNISGGSQIGSIAIGKGAVAVGSVSGNQSKKSNNLDCRKCGAARDCSRKDCKYCNTEYPTDESRIGSISISVED